jgi:RNA polymerase sigma factor (sigma-70 family)
MSAGPSLNLLRDVHTLFDFGTAAGLSDRQLLERFVARRDPAAEAAFEVLVVRHGPMVLRICRNSLADPNDVDDAFQATFLVLVKRCGSIRRLESLGSWLFGVATRVAARARFEAARRRAAEKRGALRVVKAVDARELCESEQAEFGPAVCAEVGRLPERYRSVVVLCYWQGLTQEQAAAQLGCPLGTVRSRLARAKSLLRRRLTRRGFAPLAEVVATALDSPQAARRSLARLPGALPPLLVRFTISAASRIASGEATVQIASAMSASLVENAIWRMTMVKASGIVAAITVVGLAAGLGAGLSKQRVVDPRSPATVSQAQGEKSVQNSFAASSQARAKGKTKRSESSTKAGQFEQIYSNIQGKTTIILLKPDGSAVKRGDLVCELDSAALKDELINQQITTKSAEANFQNAVLARENAGFSLQAYVDDIFPREQREAEGELKIAQTELALAQEELESKKKLAGGDNRLLELKLKLSDLAVARAKLAVDKASNRLHVLTKYTKVKQTRELTTQLESTRSNELAKQATVELEHSRERKLERQIATCSIKAPIDGMLIYANSPANPPAIEEGATVRERQLLFRIVPYPPAKTDSPSE